MLHNINRTNLPNLLIRFRIPLSVVRTFSSDTNTIISFRKVSFEYSRERPILSEVSFNIRKGNKVTIMGQNGSGKSTIIKLMNSTLHPTSGIISMPPKLVVSTAFQVMPPQYRNLTIREFFLAQLQNNSSGLESRISSALLAVQLQTATNKISLDRIVGTFSGGQQARLLFASALILEPDVLLLDEPTNNLDAVGIAFLTEFIQQTEKTCLVISHDEDFLNSFSDSVLYLDVFSHKVEQYDGDYHTVKSDIAQRIARENADNARLQREALAKKEQANKFANKGGTMRKVAKKLREEAVQMEDSRISVRREDTALKPFLIPVQNVDMQYLQSREMVTINRVVRPGDEAAMEMKTGPIVLHKLSHLHIMGPNGSGKSTLLEAIYNSWQQQRKDKSFIFKGAALSGEVPPIIVNGNATVGYYRQDFNNLDHNSTAIHCMQQASDGKHSEQDIRRIAASFLLRGEIVKQRIGALSEGQKALVSLACLVLLEPTILLVDEPTNHVNFRHIPAIAKALSAFEGTLVIVSHDKDFLSKIKIDYKLHVVNDVTYTSRQF